MQTNTIANPITNFCWKTIGIDGDRSCRELLEYIHCRHCPVYSSSSRKFLDQPFPVGYQDDWAKILAEPLPQSQGITTISCAIFRLQNEWFALPTQLLAAVTSVVPVRSIPQRSNHVLLGLVNIQGELLLCISLTTLLGITQSAIADSHQPLTNHTYPRMVIVQFAEERWIFPVDEIYGIERFAIDQIQVAPANRHQSQGIIAWQSHYLSYLDTTLFSESLRRSALS